MLNYLKAKIDKTPNFLSCGKLISKENFIHPDRIIDSFLIIIGIKSTLYIQEDKEKYNISKNEVLIMEPNKRQFSYKKSNNLVYYWMHFNFSNKTKLEKIRMEKASQTYYMLSNDAYAQKDSTILIPKKFTLSDPDKITILIHQLLDYKYGNYYSSKLSNYCLATILFELTEQAMKNHLSTHFNKKNMYFSEILEWIKANYDKKLTVKYIAEIFNYNPNYLSNLFKENTGYSLIQFINRTRISKSKELILKTNMTMKEIAYQVGFNDDKYFFKLFNKYMDITPTQYKNAYYNTHINK